MNTWDLNAEKSFYMEAAKEQQSRPEKEKKNFLEHSYHSQMQQEQRKRNWNVNKECAEREIRR